MPLPPAPMPVEAVSDTAPVVVMSAALFAAAASSIAPADTSVTDTACAVASIEPTVIEPA